jgi:hypothetical protein
MFALGDGVARGGIVAQCAPDRAMKMDVGAVAGLRRRAAA